MKLLLDTHAFIWWDGEPVRLSAPAIAACQSPDNSLHLSLAGVWEIQIKAHLGKLQLRLPLHEVLREQQERNGILLEPVTLEAILNLSSLPSHHRDPFDRILVSQTKLGNFKLVTGDPEIKKYPVQTLW